MIIFLFRCLLYFCTQLQQLLMFMLCRFDTKASQSTHKKHFTLKSSNFVFDAKTLPFGFFVFFPFLLRILGIVKRIGTKEKREQFLCKMIIVIFFRCAFVTRILPCLRVNIILLLRRDGHASLCVSPSIISSFVWLVLTSRIFSPFLRIFYSSNDLRNAPRLFHSSAMHDALISYQLVERFTGNLLHPNYYQLRSSFMPTLKCAPWRDCRILAVSVH